MSGSGEKLDRRFFQVGDLRQLVRLLRENNIAYVGIDDGVRENDLLKGCVNESLYQQNYEKVFQDTERRCDNLTIREVPSGTVGDLTSPKLVYPTKTAEAR